MTVKEIFELRKQGRIEEAYEAIRPLYATHKGRYTTLCMFWTASDIFRLRLDEGRIEEAKKIFLALKRMLPRVDDPDQKAAGFLQYAERRLRKATTSIKINDHESIESNEYSSNSCHSCSEENNPSQEKEERELSTFNSQLSTLNSPQQKVLDHIRTHPGVSVPQLNAELGIPSKSLERHISALAKTSLIAHRGSKKTGGYYPLLEKILRE